MTILFEQFLLLLIGKNKTLNKLFRLFCLPSSQPIVFFPFYPISNNFYPSSLFFETLSVGSVHGTDHYAIYAYLIRICYEAQKCINILVLYRVLFLEQTCLLREYCYRGYGFLVVIQKKDRIHSSVFGKFPIHQYYAYTTAHVLFSQISHVYQRINIPFLCWRRHVYASTVQILWLFGWKPNKGVRIKFAATVVLQDISSMFITLENPYVYISYVYSLRIKLTGFC